MDCAPFRDSPLKYRRQAKLHPGSARPPNSLRTAALCSGLALAPEVGLTSSPNAPDRCARTPPPLARLRSSSVFVADVRTHVPPAQTVTHLRCYWLTVVRGLASPTFRGRPHFQIPFSMTPLSLRRSHRLTQFAPARLARCPLKTTPTQEGRGLGFLVKSDGPNTCSVTTPKKDHENQIT